MAMHRVNGRLAQPALATQLRFHRCPVFGHGLGERLRQIKITADTALVGAIDTKDRLGCVQVRSELDLAIPGHALWIKVSQINGERF